jgi:hypothetical protein
VGVFVLCNSQLTAELGLGRKLLELGAVLLLVLVDEVGQASRVEKQVDVLEVAAVLLAGLVEVKDDCSCCTNQYK